MCVWGGGVTKTFVDLKRERERDREIEREREREREREALVEGGCPK